MSTVTAEPASATPDRLKTPLRSRIGSIVILIVLIALALFYIYPFLLEVATSFKTDDDATNAPLSLIPKTWTSAAYTTLFTENDFPIWLKNSVLVTVLVTLGRVFFDSLAGYALARLRFTGRRFVFGAMVALMSVPGIVLLIPKFLVINYLGIYDSYAGMIIPLLVDAGGVYMMKNFFESIPYSVEEQARIDGAGTFRIFWNIVLPMARPALMTIIILSFQGSWNELGHFIVATQSPKYTTLTKGVAMLSSGQYGASSHYPLKLAAAAIMTLPVAIVFFIFQKRIINTTMGAVKD